MFFKRIFDISVSLFLILLLSPVYFFIYIFSLFIIGPPVLFKQKRPGKNESPIFIYKFRTMNNKKDSNGNLLPDNERITKYGSFLRKTSLDEIPQLFNVLKGNLSLVGPRPLLMDYLRLYSKEQKKRHSVTPGITGWAQVNGRNSISWKEKFELDVWYVENWSLWLDFKILFLTFIKVLKSEGVNQNQNTTMPKFDGNN